MCRLPPRERLRVLHLPFVTDEPGPVSRLHSSLGVVRSVCLWRQLLPKRSASGGKPAGGCLMGGPSAGQKLAECMLPKSYAKLRHGISRKSVPEFRVRSAPHARTAFLTETTAWDAQLDARNGGTRKWEPGMAGSRDDVGMNPR